MENHLGLVRTGQTIKYHMGWVDVNDLATQATPIDLLVANQYYPLTNDGNGTQTTNQYKISDHRDLWDIGDQSFDFRSLKIGDTVDIRVDVTFITTAGNVDTNLKMDFAIGSGFQYPLNLEEKLLKTSGEHQITRWFGFYIGNEITRDYPARLSAAADNTTTKIKVNGFYARTWARS